MKKLFFLLAFAGLLALPEATAQLKFGIRGGITSSSIKQAQEFVGQSGNEIIADLRGGQTGWTAGGLLRVKIAMFFLQPELLFTNSKYLYTVEGSLNDDGDYEERLLSLDLPVLIGLKFGPLHLNAGPELHVGVNKTSDLATIRFYQDAVQNFTVGWVGGAGLGLAGLTLDVRYHGNLRKLGSRFEDEDIAIEFDKAPAMWSFTAGFLF